MLALNITAVLFVLLLTIWSFFSLLLGMLAYVTSGGSKEGTERARDRIQTAVIGVFVSVSLNIAIAFTDLYIYLIPLWITLAFIVIFILFTSIILYYREKKQNEITEKQLERISKEEFLILEAIDEDIDNMITVASVPAQEINNE